MPPRVLLVDKRATIWLKPTTTAAMLLQDDDGLACCTALSGPQVWLITASESKNQLLFCLYQERNKSRDQTNYAEAVTCHFYCLRVELHGTIPMLPEQPIVDFSAPRKTVQKVVCFMHNHQKARVLRKESIRPHQAGNYRQNLFHACLKKTRP